MVGRARRFWRIYFALLLAAFRSQLQYRGNLLLSMIGGVLFQTAGLAFVWVVVSKFGGIGGWSLAEVAFLYGLRLMAHAVFTAPLSQIFLLDLVVREGEFDRYLVRPVGALVQLVTRGVQLSVFGDLVAGAAVLATAAQLVDVDWTPPALAFLVMAVAGGALVEAAVQLAVSTLSFRLVSVRSIRVTIDQIFGTFSGYPLSIFPTAVRFGVTFLLPLAFVAYLPATVLLDRTGELSVSPWFAYLSPLAGGLLFYAAYLFWRRQTRHYNSTGH